MFFFILEYRETHFSRLCCLKYEGGKIANFWPKPLTYSFEKISIFSTFLTCCFYGLEKCFFILEYRKTHLHGLCCLKYKGGKLANFWPKSWTNPFRKIQIFDFLNFLFFLGVERRFFFLEYRETHLPGVFSRQQKDGKIDHFRPKPWTNPLGKFWFLDFFNFSFS